MADIIKTQPPQTTLAQLIQQKMASFADVATKYLSPERLVKLAQLAISKMPDLQKVPATDIIAELINCSRLGLEPNVEGGRWLLPFKRHGKNGGPDRYELVAITDYRGLIDIARRSGEVVAIHSDMRHAKDHWEYWVDSSGDTLVHLKHEIADGARGDMMGSYAIVKLRGGEVQAAYLTMDEIAEAKDSSASKDSQYSPWQKRFASMAKKTAVRRLYNFLPKTPEIQAAREVLAEEEERERAFDAIDVTPGAVDAPKELPVTTTDKIKEKLAARAKPSTPPAEPSPSPEPKADPPKAAEPASDNCSRNARIAKIREEAKEKHGELFADAWADACRECANGKPSTQWSEKEILAVTDYLSRWRSLPVEDATDKYPGVDPEAAAILTGEREPGSDDD